jgi:capsular polysaccharide biosynthesis protein
MQTKVAAERPYFHSAHIGKLRRLACGQRELEDVATSCEELSPAKKHYHPRPVFEESDLRRITGLGAGTTQAYEMEQTQAVWRTHKATVAYTVPDLLHIEGNFYARRFKHGVTLSSGKTLAWGQAPEIAGGVLGQTWLGAKYFGHWLLEDIPLAWLAADRGFALGAERQLQPQQVQYLELFNAPLNLLPAAAFIRSLDILQDSGLNDLSIQRWRRMRRQFAGTKQTGITPGVFLMRGSTGEQRLLSNEVQVANLLTARGFNVVNPGMAGLTEVRAATANARIVVGVEGSQLSHGLLGVADHGALLVLQPPFRFNNAYRERCDMLDITYAFIVGHAVEDGFTVNLNALSRLLDRLDLPRNANF